MRILYIGKYKEKGQFSTIQWKYFIEWCKEECNSLIVYSRMPYDAFRTIFSCYCNIDILEKPDVILDVYAYKIEMVDIRFWNYIEEYDYNIDAENDVSHMFFLNGDRNIASLEIVDYENYVLIEEPINQEDIFLFQKEMIIENMQFCVRGKEDIDEIARGEGWQPLGCV